MKKRGDGMQDSLTATVGELTTRKPGRPSQYPERVAYQEHPSIVRVMQEIGQRQGMTFSDIQRTINRAGLQALGVTAKA